MAITKAAAVLLLVLGGAVIVFFMIVMSYAAVCGIPFLFDDEDERKEARQ